MNVIKPIDFVFMFLYHNDNNRTPLQTARRSFKKGDKTMKKMFRITIVDRNGNKRTVNTFAKSEKELKEDTKRLAPLSIIESITEVTSETLIIKRV